MASISTRTRKDGSKSWVVRIKHTIDGHQHTESRTFSDRKYKRKDAEAWARARETELALGSAVGPSAAKVTLGELVAWYIEEFAAYAGWGTTKKNDLNRLQTYPIAARPAHGLRAKDYVDHIRCRRKTGISAATANNDIVWYRVVQRRANAAFGTDINLSHIDSAAEVLRQMKMIGKSQERDRRPTLGELEQLLQDMNESDGRQTTPMVDITLFQIFSARRISETCRITWDDYDEDAKTVIVRNMKHPRKKQGNDVVTHLTDQACAIINRQPRIQGEPRIFPYNSKSVGSNFRLRCQVLGIDDLHHHDLRHEGTSWLFETGMDIPRVALHTGHRSWAQLQRYTHLQHKEPFDKYADWKWLKHKHAGRLQIVR
ncbi:MAG: site-specific integrase [Pseudomonadota bacterium]